jgi:hypothetical protein
MPAANISIRPNFTMSTLYALTVNSGTGGGNYAATTVVPISANSVSGQGFQKWTGATNYLDTPLSSTANVTMPASTVTVTANYTNTLYALTVNSGTGSGSYVATTVVSISANSISGEGFQKWTGDTNYLDTPLGSTANVTMPTNTVTITANYTNIPASGGVLQYLYPGADSPTFH